MNPTAETFRELWDQLVEGVYLVDTDRKILFWNRSATRISGFAPEECVGRHCSDNFLRHIDGTGKELCRDSCPLSRTIADGHPRLANAYLHHKDGHRIAVRLVVSPVHDHTGKMVGAIETFMESSPRAVPHPKAGASGQFNRPPSKEILERRHALHQIREMGREAEAHGWKTGFLVVRLENLGPAGQEKGDVVANGIRDAVQQTLAHSLLPFDLQFVLDDRELVIVQGNQEWQNLTTFAEHLASILQHTTCGRSAQAEPIQFAIAAGLAQTPQEVDSTLPRLLRLLDRTSDQGPNRVVMLD